MLQAVKPAVQFESVSDGEIGEFAKTVDHVMEF
jgi:hypothetical protein